MATLLRLLAVLLLLLGGVPAATAGLTPTGSSPTSNQGEEEQEERAESAATAREGLSEVSPTRLEGPARLARVHRPARSAAAPSSERGVRLERRAPLRC